MNYRKTLALTGTCVIASSLFVATSSSASDADPHGGMLRYPDVGPEYITFVYANDIWIVPCEGGQATAIASPPGAEASPKFSPDGTTIAFSGNYDGGRDIYTIPTLGGIPTRITHHPAGETLSGWTEDGRIIFNTNYNNGSRNGINRQQHIYTVDAVGGLPERLPVPYGGAAAISSDGEWLAYTPFNRDTRTWKRYRGGNASDIWLFNLNDNTSKQITDWEGTDSIPMWHNDTVYYLSDAGAEEKLNLWSYDTKSNKRKQITRFSDFDVKWPSIGPGKGGSGEIVFQYGTSLYLFDIQTNTSHTVEVMMPGDRPTIREKSVDVTKMFQAGGISSTGKRAVIQARGDIWTAPAEKGAPRNLTKTNGVFERDPAWSPDGRWIAYFSDQTDEYELYITQSDGKGETKQLTSGSNTFYMNPTWSPDSENITYIDKAGNIWLHTLETEDTKLVATDPFAFDFGRPTLNWSHDSQWLTFALANEGMTTSVWLYNKDNGSLEKVTSGMFADSSPVFDRKGDFLYFSSTRSFAPTYSDVDTTFIYKDSQVLLAVPLRDDVESPWLEESDEEEFKDEDAEDQEEAVEDETDEEDNGEIANEEPIADDGVSGTWTCTVSGAELPPGGMEITITLSVSPDGSVSGSVDSPMGSGSISGSFDKASGKLDATISTDDGGTVSFIATISNGSMTGTISSEDFSGDISGSRTSSSTGSDDEDSDKDEEAAETVEIDINGFERRAIQLPVAAGNFGKLAVNNKNQLIYARSSSRGGAPGAAIKLYDINDDSPSEKEVAKGAGNFDISGDGKKILIRKGSSFAIQNASAGSSGKNVVTSGMKTTIDPRQEWRQIFNDAWRLERIYFYDPNMHDVNWEAVRSNYAAMLDDCVNREDVGFVIREMISELNVGHAYYGGGDIESSPNESVGMLGVDYELHDGAYRITKIYEGAVWDSDARGPLSQPGININEGDYILAVNGTEINTSKDPWAAFVGLAGKSTTLTVSEKTTIDEDAREVIIKPLSNEGNLRYRAWIEMNRKYVEDQTDGRVGYVYVPNTGINGQNDLVRQFLGQTRKDAIIIDERWNGGGQIPTRFIELLNRPATNYWARRDQGDWMWPPDSHQGAKCMLINGPSGSGGDAFPYYFKQAGLGKLIGRRTWGGLVGMSGSPGLMDNASVTVPTFAFYENDGTWGIEGHGVDPDIDVVDDPALMTKGGDPQLDAAIELMLAELSDRPYKKPNRPAYPNRSGIGVTDEDK